MKNKIIYSDSNKETGKSIITIQNKYGKFTGTAQCSPDDMNSFSAFAGERYAEIRANTKFAKLRYRQEKIKLNAINSLLKDISLNCPPEEEHTEILKRIKLKKRDYEQSVEDWKNLYEYLKKAISIQDKQREEILLRSSKIK